MLKKIFPPIHPEGIRFGIIFAVSTLLLFAIAKPLGWLGVLLTAWCFYFFRNPERVTPNREGLVISPADGLVLSVTSVIPPKDLFLPNTPFTRISIFMNVFDVHVNRVPIDGVIEHTTYHQGQFLNASFDKASDLNERQSVTLRTKSGAQVGFVQIAGLIARRIRCDAKVGQEVKAGERYGIIRFGSRMDVYLPEEVPVFVCPGQRTIGGETVLADFASKEITREGLVR